MARVSNPSPAMGRLRLADALEYYQALLDAIEHKFDGMFDEHSGAIPRKKVVNLRGYTNELRKLTKEMRALLAEGRIDL